MNYPPKITKSLDYLRKKRSDEMQRVSWYIPLYKAKIKVNYIMKNKYCFKTIKNIFIVLSGLNLCKGVIPWYQERTP
jgi:hypothetical protein